MDFPSTLPELIAARDYVTAEIETIHRAAPGTLDADTQSRFDEGVEYVRQANDLIRRHNLVAGLADNPGARQQVTLDSDPVGDPDSIRDPSTIKNPWDLNHLRALAVQSPERQASEMRARALCAAERAQGMSDTQRATLTRWIDDTDEADISESEGTARFLRHVIATSSPDYLRAWTKAFKAVLRGARDPEAEAVLSRAMSLTDNAGGYAVPQQLDPTLILTSDGSTNPIRQIARKVMATGDVWTGLSTNHASWSFDAEGAEVSDDATTFASPSITVRTARGFIPFSLEIGMDYPGFTVDLQRILALGKDDLEATVFATGASGSNQPIGIVTALTGGSYEVASNTTDTFALSDVYDLEEELPAKYRARASWIANHRIYTAMREAGGANLDDFWANLRDGRPPQLLGHPAYEASAMDGVINAGAHNYVLVIGDFENYVIADRVGFSIELIPHLFATANNLPSGQRGLFAYYRVGADSVNDAAFRMLNVT